MQRVKAAPKALLPWLALLSALATVAVNAAANALPLNGLKTGEISDRFAVYFVPAGYVFAVWGLIYVGILAFSVYQLRPAVREDPRLAGVRPWFLASNLANAAWVFLWHYERFPLTLVAMGALLASSSPSTSTCGVGWGPRSLGALACGRALQPLPGLDLRGRHRERRRGSGLCGMVRLGAFPGGVDGRRPRPGGGPGVAPGPSRTGGGVSCRPPLGPRGHRRALPQQRLRDPGHLGRGASCGPRPRRRPLGQGGAALRGYP